MTNEEQTLQEVRAQIHQLSDEDHIRVTAIATTLRNITQADPLALLAFALVGAELAARKEDG